MKEVKFILSESDFALIDRDLKTVVEPGTFQIMVGASSDDIRLQTKVEIKQDIYLSYREKGIEEFQEARMPYQKFVPFRTEMN